MGNITEILSGLAAQFDRVNVAGLSFEAECFFAEQQIQRNKFTADMAAKNPASLADAIMSVGAVGLSLSPASALCYLVPRDGKIALDISYRGLVRLATDAGSILAAKPILVYESDKFVWRGPSEMPIHEADVFAPSRIDAQQPLKGLVGGYCVAWLPSGAVMVDVMSVAEIMAVKNASKADKGPWSGAWAGEMAKKTLVKRASKSWPTTITSGRLDAAISASDESEDMDSPVHVPAPNSVSLDILPPESERLTQGMIGKADPLAAARRPAPAPEPAPTPAPKIMSVFHADGTTHSNHTGVRSWLTAFEELAATADKKMGSEIIRQNALAIKAVDVRGLFNDRLNRVMDMLNGEPTAAPAAPAEEDDVF